MSNRLVDYVAELNYEKITGRLKERRLFLEFVTQRKK